MDDGARHSDDARVVQMVQIQKEGDIIQKSLSKLKETGTVWLSLKTFLSWKHYVFLKSQ